MGTVTVNDQQLYYKQQAAEFKPFDSTSAGGVAAVRAGGAGRSRRISSCATSTAWRSAASSRRPRATASNPRIDALVGPHATYLPDLQLLSKKYVNQDIGPYLLSYKYFDPSDPKANKSPAM